tara:strand:+ start:892 stop:1164 length:273 start_codon:yes stop_codon:yes gene_type:complete
MIVYILSSIIAILLYVSINTFRKLERSDDTVLQLLDRHNALKTRIAETIVYMKEIDSKGGFESDDEVGTVFDALKKELELLEDIYDIIED